MEKFVLVATQRSGTVFFESVINSHPHIYCYPEILLSLSYQQEWNFYHFWLEKVKQDESNITHPAMLRNFELYLNHIFNNVPGKKAIGIDIKYDQFPQILNIFYTLKKNDVKIIHLVRKNVLKTYISSVLNWNKRSLNRLAHSTKEVPSVKVKIKLGNYLVQELERRKNEIAHYRNFFHKNKFKCLEINYEDFFDNSNSESSTIVSPVLNQIYEFLCIKEKRYDLTTDLKKTNPNKLAELIENYDEVAGFLSGTEWACLLEGDSIKDIIKRGEALYKKNEYDKALNEFAKVIERDPNNFIAYNGIGVINWELGNMEKSIEGFTKALELNPLDQSIVINAVNILKLLGRVEEAKDICSSYLKIKQDDVEVKDVYADIQT
jgi:tetratricopeptide (TPR) repeat protein